ncbi:restriction endonuclease subunit S [Campylobacter coli]
MNNWKKCKLGDIAEVVGGGTPSTKVDEYWNGDIAWITPKDLTSYNKVFISKGARSITKLGLSQSSAKLMPKGTVLLTSRAPIGYIAIAENEISTNQGFKSLIPKENLTTSKFLYYWLKNNVEYLKNLSVGTTFAEISGQIVKEVEILLPPLEEQRQIADILSSIDDKIELLHEQNKTLEELAQTLFRHYFIENPSPSWQEKPLSEIAKFLNGLACQKYPPKNFLDKLPVLKIKELSDGAIGKNPDYASSEIADDYIVNSGDVIFSWSATLMVKIWGGEKSVLNQHLFKVNSDKYPKWFFYYWTKYHLREFITISQAHATTMGHIKRKDLDNAMCKIPKDEYLKKCDLEISPKIKKIENNLNQIRTLENMRDILIPKLLNGERKE